MPFVQRRDGAIAGAFACAQPGYAEEFLADDAPEVVAFLNPTSDPGTTPPTLVAAAYGLEIADGDVSNIEGIFNLIAALYLDVGQYMLLFAEAQPDMNYFPMFSGGAPSMACTERSTDYLIIEARDAVGGSPVDPPQFSVEVRRI